MTVTITLDGAEWAPEVLQPPRVPSLASMQFRAEMRGTASPSALLGMATVACSSSIPDARAMLRNDFGFPKTRATLAVKVGASLIDSFVANTALGYLAGVKMTATQSSTLMSLLPGSTRVDGASKDLVSHEAVRKFWERRQFGRLARKTARTDDRSSLAVCAALLASRWDDPSSGSVAAALVRGLAETFMGPKRPSEVQQAADRVLSAAYAMSALSTDGLDLGSETWSGASADWRFRAAFWLLALLDEETSPALVDLLNAVSARGLKFVQPGQSPFMHDDSREVTEESRNLAVGNAADLTKWSDWPIWFSGGPGEIQVLLTQDEVYAFAWVGRNDRGQLVAFDTTDFIGWGLDEPGMVQALAYAIGWYVDVSISLRTNRGGTNTVRRTTGGSRSKGISYKPTPTYIGQRTAVARGTQNPPTPHMRAAHVRDLVNRNPSEEALSHAPLKYRRQFGPHETWVRRASVGGAATHKEVENHLSKNSALANVLGLMDRQANS